MAARSRLAVPSRMEGGSVQRQWCVFKVWDRNGNEIKDLPG